MVKKSVPENLVEAQSDAKRYTLTFKTSVADIERPLDRVRSIGVQVQSMQKFIGTAVVRADSAQVEKLKAMDEVAGIAETGTLAVMPQGL